jgi:hypothetical protein
MRLLVKRGNSLVNDLKFSSGPIYIGRHPKSHVFLPDRAVSRQHAIILKGPDESWVIKDCDSANRTLVNGRPVSRQPLYEGDVISIADFSLEFHTNAALKPSHHEQPVDMGETLVHSQEVVPSIYAKKHEGARERTLHLAAGRLRHLFEVMSRLHVAEDQEQLLPELTKLLMQQFDAYHVWVGLRETTSGPLTCHGGLTRGGEPVGLEGLLGQALVKQAVKTETYILMPDVADAAAAGDSLVGHAEQLRSVLVAPIVAPAGAYGVDQSPYTAQDMDFLTVVSTHVAALIEHLG